jgi:hypothetical protein
VLHHQQLLLLWDHPSGDSTHTLFGASTYASIGGEPIWRVGECRTDDHLVQHHQRQLLLVIPTPGAAAAPQNRLPFRAALLTAAVPPQQAAGHAASVLDLV